MSDGLKIGLALGGVGLVGFLLWKNSQTASSAGAGVAGAVTIPGTGSALAAVPGNAVAPPPPPPASSGGSSSSGGSVSVSTSTLKTIGTYAVAGAVIVPTKLAVTGVKDAYSAIKSIF